MKKLTVKEVHHELLLMLKDIIKVCNNNNINYYLSGGTLLGAVRHQGFIPWDDDIDIMMFRADYAKFERIYSTEGKYNLWCKKNKQDWNAPWNRVENKNTLLINENSSITNGLFIDIFPIDFVSEKKFFRRITVTIAKVLDTLRNGAKRKNYKNDEGFIILKKLLINPIGSFIGSYRLSVIIDSFAKTVGRLSCKKELYCGVIVVCYHYKMNEFVPYTIYEKNIELKFENINVSAPRGYQEYLTSLYGDYMKLPPIELQIAGHYPVYWID